MDKKKIISPRVGYVLLKDVTVKYKGTKDFDEIRHKQPQLAQVVQFNRPTAQEREYIPWDNQIKVGVVILKPVTQKYEFDTGDGRKLLVCHHSDIKVFFGGGLTIEGLSKAVSDGSTR